MKIVDCDLHAKQQTIAMVDTETAEVSEKTLAQEGEQGARVLRCLTRSGDGGYRSYRSHADPKPKGLAREKETSLIVVRDVLANHS